MVAGVHRNILIRRIGEKILCGDLLRNMNTENIFTLVEFWASGVFKNLPEVAISKTISLIKLRKILFSIKMIQLKIDR